MDDDAQSDEEGEVVWGDATCSQTLHEAGGLEEGEEGGSLAREGRLSLRGVGKVGGEGDMEEEEEESGEAPSVEGTSEEAKEGALAAKWEFTLETSSSEGSEDDSVWGSGIERETRGSSAGNEDDHDHPNEPSHPQTCSQAFEGTSVRVSPSPAFAQFYLGFVGSHPLRGRRYQHRPVEVSTEGAEEGGAAPCSTEMLTEAQKVAEELWRDLATPEGGRGGDEGEGVEISGGGGVVDGFEGGGVSARGVHRRTGSSMVTSRHSNPLWEECGTAGGGSGDRVRELSSSVVGVGRSDGFTSLPSTVRSGADRYFEDVVDEVQRGRDDGEACGGVWCDEGGGEDEGSMDASVAWMAVRGEEQVGGVGEADGEVGGEEEGGKEGKEVDGEAEESGGEGGDIEEESDGGGEGGERRELGAVLRKMGSMEEVLAGVQGGLERLQEAVEEGRQHPQRPQQPQWEQQRGRCSVDSSRKAEQPSSSRKPRPHSAYTIDTSSSSPVVESERHLPPPRPVSASDSPQVATQRGPPRCSAALQRLKAHRMSLSQNRMRSLSSRRMHSELKDESGEAAPSVAPALDGTATSGDRGGVAGIADARMGARRSMGVQAGGDPGALLSEVRQRVALLEGMVAQVSSPRDGVGRGVVGEGNRGGSGGGVSPRSVDAAGALIGRLRTLEAILLAHDAGINDEQQGQQLSDTSGSLTAELAKCVREWGLFTENAHNSRVVSMNAQTASPISAPSSLIPLHHSARPLSSSFSSPWAFPMERRDESVAWQFGESSRSDNGVTPMYEPFVGFTRVEPPERVDSSFPDEEDDVWGDVSLAEGTDVKRSSPVSSHPQEAIEGRAGSGGGGEGRGGGCDEGGEEATRPLLSALAEMQASVASYAERWTGRRVDSAGGGGGVADDDRRYQDILQLSQVLGYTPSPPRRPPPPGIGIARQRLDITPPPERGSTLDDAREGQKGESSATTGVDPAATDADGSTGGRRADSDGAGGGGGTDSRRFQDILQMSQVLGYTPSPPRRPPSPDIGIARQHFDIPTPSGRGDTLNEAREGRRGKSSATTGVDLAAADADGSTGGGVAVEESPDAASELLQLAEEASQFGSRVAALQTALARLTTSRRAQTNATPSNATQAADNDDDNDNNPPAGLEKVFNAIDVNSDSVAKRRGQRLEVDFTVTPSPHPTRTASPQSTPVAPFGPSAPIPARPLSSLPQPYRSATWRPLIPRDGYETPATARQSIPQETRGAAQLRMGATYSENTGAVLSASGAGRVTDGYDGYVRIVERARELLDVSSRPLQMAETLSAMLQERTSRLLTATSNVLGNDTATASVGQVASEAREVREAVEDMAYARLRLSGGGRRPSAEGWAHLLSQCGDVEADACSLVVESADEEASARRQTDWATGAQADSVTAAREVDSLRQTAGVLELDLARWRQFHRDSHPNVLTESGDTGATRLLARAERLRDGVAAVAAELDVTSHEVGYAETAVGELSARRSRTKGRVAAVAARTAGLREEASRLLSPTASVNSSGRKRHPFRRPHGDGEGRDEPSRSDDGQSRASTMVRTAVETTDLQSGEDFEKATRQNRAGGSVQSTQGDDAVSSRGGVATVLPASSGSLVSGLENSRGGVEKDAAGDDEAAGGGGGGLAAALRRVQQSGRLGGSVNKPHQMRRLSRTVERLQRELANSDGGGSSSSAVAASSSTSSGLRQSWGSTLRGGGVVARRRTIQSTAKRDSSSDSGSE